MVTDKEALLRIHASCCNGQSVDQLMGHYTPQTRTLLDGCLVGEGHEGVRRALAREFEAGTISRVEELDGEPVLVEYDAERGQPKAVLRMEARGGRVVEVHIDHREKAMRQLLETP